MSSGDIENVVPVIAPRKYFELGNWPGPYSYVRSPSLGITWSILHPDQAMVYVNHDRALSWEQDSIDWRRRAQQNLRRLSAAQLWTHEKRNEAGRLQWAAMMHGDGLGSSRLLLKSELLSELAGDYLVGLPDRSCAVVVPLAAGCANLNQVGEMVRGMFQGATNPVLGDLVVPADLEFDS
jgi:hypothetical protein